jgi:hypothetical protein
MVKKSRTPTAREYDAYIPWQTSPMSTADDVTPIEVELQRISQELDKFEA